MWYLDSLDAAMKLGMREFASGVAILACVDKDEQRHAMTVTSLTSVSDNPPSLLVCLHQETKCNAILEQDVLFTVNILGEQQESISNLCAFSPDNETRFLEGDWQTRGNSPLPYLADGLVSFVCRVKQRNFYGTHHIVVGDIESVFVNEDMQNPLLYLRGDYGQVRTEK